jgi:hypothetical protein
VAPLAYVATSEPSNLTPPPTVTESKGAEPPTLQRLA